MLGPLVLSQREKKVPIRGFSSARLSAVGTLEGGAVCFLFFFGAERSTMCNPWCLAMQNFSDPDTLHAVRATLSLLGDMDNTLSPIVMQTMQRRRDLMVHSCIA